MLPDVDAAGPADNQVPLLCNNNTASKTIASSSSHLLAIAVPLSQADVGVPNELKCKQDQDRPGRAAHREADGDGQWVLPSIQTLH